MRLAIAAALLAACHSPRQAYTCAEMVGPSPDQQVAILPSLWSAVYSLDSKSGRPHFQGLKDERDRLRCDANGKDVPR